MKTKAPLQPFKKSRRTFLRQGTAALTSLAFVGTGPNPLDDECETVHQTIKILNLPAEFKGFTIGMISDIHSSVFMNKADMDKYVIAMNALQADLVVVTGDFVNSKTEEVYPFAESFSGLRAPYGVYGCLGNHDYFANNVELVAKEVNDCGVTLLRNNSVKIQKGNALINLAGVDDIGRGVDPNDYLDKALGSAKNEVPTILLCHKPYYFQDVEKRKIDLTLSGHTHGGQIVFGKIGNLPLSLATLASKYIAGLYTLGNSQLYVNRGIGSVGLPFRVNCPPELTKIILA